MHPRLKRFLRVYHARGSQAGGAGGPDAPAVVLCSTPRLAMEISGDPVLLRLLPRLTGRQSLDELVAAFAVETGLDAGSVRRAVLDLVAAGLVEDAAARPATLTPREEERYDRHLVFYSMFSRDRFAPQEALKRCAVTLVGAGGIGSWLALALAAAGVGRITLVDHDTVELSNLTRQVLYTEADVGNKKVHLAAARLKALNPCVEVVPVDLRVRGPEDLRAAARADLVILSADRPRQIHDWVDEACRDLGVPYSAAGYTEYVGAVGPLTIPGRTSCLMCRRRLVYTGDLEPLRLGEIGGAGGGLGRASGGLGELAGLEDMYQVPSFGPLNAIVASLQASEAVKLLTGLGNLRTLDRRLHFDWYDSKLSWTKYKRDPSCPRCGRGADRGDGSRVGGDDHGL